MSYALANNKSAGKSKDRSKEQAPESIQAPTNRAPVLSDSIMVSNNERMASRLSAFVKSKQTHGIAVGTLSLCAGILLWHLATLYNFNFFINFENIPSPLKVADAFIDHLAKPVFYTHIFVSIRRILIAYGMAVLLGVLIGLAVGRSRLARAAVLPYIEVVRPIPAVAWIPLAP